MQEIPKAFRCKGKPYAQIERAGSFAIYQVGDGHKTEHYELVRIRVAQEITWPNGQVSPEREYYPSENAWGKDGWTFTSASHRDPLQSVRDKMVELARNAKQIA